MQPKRFEIGKTYQHTSGQQLFICGLAQTIFHGTTLIAEEGWEPELLLKRQKEMRAEFLNGDYPDKAMESINLKGLVPVSMEEWATDNYIEIPKEAFIKSNVAEK